MENINFIDKNMSYQNSYFKKIENSLYLLLITVLFIGSSSLYATSKAVTQITTYTQSSRVTTYTGTDNKAYSWGNGKEVVLDTFTADENVYSPSRVADKVIVRRVDNDTVTGKKCALFAERDANNDYKLMPSLECNPATIMSGRVINRGWVDVFSNKPRNNIERVDFVFTNGLIAPSDKNDLGNTGFITTEKSGNNPTVMAVITDIDEDGNPTAYAPLVKVWPVGSGEKITYGMTGYRFNFSFLQDGDDPSSQDGKPTKFGTSNEDMGIAFVTLDDLGISTGQKIYGFSYFSQDIYDASQPNRVASGIDPVDYKTFPTDTSGAGDVADADMYGGVAGYFSLVKSISGKAYKDSNKNGTKDAKEDSLANISVDLYADSNANGVLDSGETKVATSETNPNGEYSFNVGSNANYLIVIDTNDSDISKDLEAPTNNPIAVSVTTSDVTNKDFPFLPIDTDNDGVPDDIDLDNDNDGILDINEGTCDKKVYPAGWFSVYPNHGTDNQDGYYPDINKDPILGSPYHDSSLVKSTTPTHYGTGLNITLHDYAYRIKSVGEKSLADAILADDYLEYEFTTSDTISADSVIDRIGINLTKGNFYGNYKIGILFSDDNFTTSTTLIENYTPFGGDIQLLPISHSDSLSPNTSYKFRVYLYGEVDDDEEVYYDDFYFGLCSNQDTDGDTISDYLDLDSDNDGIPDNVEAQTTNGYIVPSGKVDTNGTWSDIYGVNGLIPVDTDEDNISDMLDLDSDNDGKLDKDESGRTLSGDVGKNGLDNSVDTKDDYSDVNGKVNNPSKDLKEEDSNTTDVDYRSVATPNTPPVVYDNNQTVYAGTIVPLDLNGTATDADGDSVMISTINDKVLTGDEQNITVPNGIVHIDESGTVTLIPNKGFTGTISFPFEGSDGTDIATANVNVIVKAIPIDAVNDVVRVNGFDGGESNIVLNDKLNGKPFKLGTEVDIKSVTDNTPLDIDTKTGKVTVASGTPAGTYVESYTICESLNPTNCDTAKVTVEVTSAPMVGNNDSNNSVPSRGGEAIENVTANDTLNGLPFVLGRDANITNITDKTPFLEIDPKTGKAIVKEHTPAGTYTEEYTVCENLNPTNCVTQEVSVTVEAPSIDAIDDDFTSNPIFTTGGVVGDVTTKGNDTLNGIDVDDSLVRLKLIPSESNLTSVSLDNNGTLRVHAGTEEGTYNVVYQLCEVLNPTNCDKANVKLVVLLDSDGDGIADIDDLDDDNDGILDTVEEATASNGGDTDGDGVPDRLDLDSDNDGILDLLESGQEPSVVDKDGNGILDSTTDEDSDGVMDSADANDHDPTSEGRVTPIDTDGDGKPDFQDVDSDNDGMSDLTEAGILPINDKDNDGMVDGDVDKNGIPTTVKPVTTPPNTDGDKVPDYRDLDSDNDGLTDVEEAGLTDSNGDGLDDTPNETFANPNEIPNQDGDEIVDPLEPNNPNLPKAIDSDGDGVIDDTTDTDSDGIPNITDGTPKVFATTPILDSDNDGIPDSLDLDDDNDGILDTVEEHGTTDLDTDGDGIPDRLDLDSDNDGLLDLLESGQDVATVDTDNNGILDSTTDKDRDGVMDVADKDDNDATSEGTVIPIDTDGDIKFDFQDVDSDNDSLSDMVEAGVPAENDNDSDGVIDNPAVDSHGVPTVVDYITTPVNTDGDGVPDYRDLDSDNDGLNDVDEVEGLDDNRDGISDEENSLVDGTTIPDSDGDNTPNVLEPNNSNLPVAVDSDGDGVIDDATDNDNDGIPDVTDANDNIFGTGESIDSDGDGVTNEFDIDDDNDGIPDTIENKGNPSRDTDGDGVIDSLDLDSDNDGMLDILEAGGIDSNNDGRVDDTTDSDRDGLADIVDSKPKKADNPVDEDRGRAVTLLLVPDTDGDGEDDFQDVDSDNDGLSDLVEAGVPLGNDEDNNGRVDNPAVDENGVPTIITPVAQPLDSDSDKLPDYRELDSDDDGTSDIIEAGAIDENGDGLVDNKGTLVDVSNLPDVDGDGIPNYREVNKELVEAEVRPDKRVADLSEPVTVEVLNNDIGDFNNSSVWIELPDGFMNAHPDAKLSEDRKRLVVPGEGVWSVNSDGTITYRAEEKSIKVDPTPISYSVVDKSGERLETDALIVLKGSQVKDATDTAEDCGCKTYEDNVSLYDNWTFILVAILGSIFGWLYFRGEEHL